MIEKILFYSIIGLALNSLIEKSYNIEAIYELKPLQSITLLITTRCNITKVEIDGEIVDNFFVVYSEHYINSKMREFILYIGQLIFQLVNHLNLLF